jgi:O-methyltransferase
MTALNGSGYTRFLRKATRAQLVRGRAMLSSNARRAAGFAERAERRAWVKAQLRAGIGPLTMVDERGLRGLAAAVDLIVGERIEGCFVECGTWRGGASFLMARRSLRQGSPRQVWMFDSFEGLPPPGPADGPSAAAYTADTKSPWYYDNCTASFDAVEASARDLGLRTQVQPVKGWFDQTLPSHKVELGSIALLRIDADWHESVATCLEELVPLVANGGVVILDDYHTWDGCTRATHEFLCRHDLPYRIGGGFGGASFRIPR